MKRHLAPTLKDVAREAAATVSAASVVLNGASSSARISEGTRSRILEAAARLHYRRNAVALGLSQRRMNAIGVAATIRGCATNHYFLAVLSGILQAATDRGQSVTVFAVPPGEKGAQTFQECCDGRIDGLILVAPYIVDSLMAIVNRTTPIVAIQGSNPSPNYHNVDIDDEGGAYAATRYLLDLGHREIAYFTGPLELAGARRRVRGFERATAESGISRDASPVIPGYYTMESGVHRTAELIARYGRAALPTAIFCANDAAAFGCIQTLAAYAIRVPQDISIIGFDDTHMAQMTRPLLTTVRQPFDEMARCAVDLLLAEIDHRERSESVCEPVEALPIEPTARPSLGVEVLSPSLVVRESTGPPSR